MTAATWHEMTIPEWHAAAACAEVGGGLWDQASGPDVVEAIGICAGCPVRQVCLDYALAREGRRGPRGRVGIWGGLGPTERAQLARRRAQALQTT